HHLAQQCRHREGPVPAALGRARRRPAPARQDQARQRPSRRKRRMSVKTIYLAKRNPSTTYEEFQKNWADHAVLSGSFPDVGARFNAVVQVKRIVGLEDEPGLFQEYDGANLLTL